MRILPACLAALLACAGASALAQTPSPQGATPDTGARPGNEIGTGMSLPLSDKAENILPQQDGSALAGRLPTPEVDENASVRDFLMAARGALAAGRTGEAQEAMERAQTRALDRSVPLFQTNQPAQDPLIKQIHNALYALGGGDRMQAMQLLEQAIATTRQQK